MCGFIGSVNLKSLRNMSGLQTRFERAYEYLSKRGPDSKGTWNDQYAYFMHARLKVIDLSEASSQPMQKDNYIICFNGEIYNFKTLRKELENKGYSFFSNGDTEVLVSAWQEWGAAMLEKLDGMFAFSIWDKKHKTLFLARDRFGKKPLAYSDDNGQINFSSDVRSLKEITNTGGLNHDAIKSLFRFRFIYEPLTIFKNFKKLPAGHYIKYDNYGIKVNRWYKLKNSKASNLDFDFYKNDLKKCLTEAVEKRLMSDVPIGLFLSGGLDSGLILNTLATFDKKIPCFTVGYSDSAKYYNEVDNASKIAKYYNFNHNKIILSSKDTYNFVSEALESSDEPFADSSALPMYMMTKAVKNHIKVALTGDGGDEIFGGYRKYISYKWFFLVKLFPKNFRKSLASLLSDNKNNPISDTARRLRRLLKNTTDDFNKMQINFLDQLNDHEHISLFSSIKDTLDSSIFENDIDSSDKINNVLARDFSFSLLGDMLVKLDRFSMTHGIELRSPFLDKSLVELAFSIPSKYKVGYLGGKKIIKSSFSKNLPEWYINLPKKGFEVPLQNWLNKDLKYLVEEATSKNVIESLEILQPDQIFKWKEDFFSGKKDNSWKLWTLISYEKWAKNNNII